MLANSGGTPLDTTIYIYSSNSETYKEKQAVKLEFVIYF